MSLILCLKKLPTDGISVSNASSRTYRPESRSRSRRWQCEYNSVTVAGPRSVPRLVNSRRVRINCTGSFRPSVLTTLTSSWDETPRAPRFAARRRWPSYATLRGVALWLGAGGCSACWALFSSRFLFNSKFC